MAKDNKTNSTSAKKAFSVPAPILMIATLVEVVAGFLAAYLLLNNFTHIVAVTTGWFFLVQSSLILVIVFVLAFFKK